MSYLDQLLKRQTEERELNVNTVINGYTLGQLLGVAESNSGKVVNASTALQLTAVYACIRLLSETFASLPAILYRRVRRAKERATDHPLYHVLHDQANREMTSVEFRSTMMAHTLLWGHSYAEVVRNGAGEVKELWPITPTRVKPDTNKRNERVYVVSLPGNETVRIAAGRMLHVSGMLGMSPISQAREALGLTMAAEEYGARFFANDSRPGGVLEHPGHLSDGAAERVRKQWESSHGGLSNRHRVTVLEEGMKWNQIGLPPEDSQFLETRKFQISEIARMFGVPPFMIGDVERSTSWGAGIEQQNIGFIIYSLRSWLVRWEQEISKTLLTEAEREEYFAEFLVDGLLRGDYKSRQEGLSIMRNNGIVNADEWRAIENMNEIEGGGGQVYLVNGGMKTVDQIEAEAQKAAEPEPEPEAEDEEPDVVDDGQVNDTNPGNEE